MSSYHLHSPTANPSSNSDHHRSPTLHHHHPQHHPPAQVNGHHPPPPLPGEPVQSSKHFSDLEMKYNRLKRKYFEMEGRMKDERRDKEETHIQMMRMKNERRQMLDRIAQLEAEFSPSTSSPRRGSAFPVILKPPELSVSTISRLKSTLQREGEEETNDGRELPSGSARGPPAFSVVPFQHHMPEGEDRQDGIMVGSSKRPVVSSEANSRQSDLGSSKRRGGRQSNKKQDPSHNLPPLQMPELEPSTSQSSLRTRRPLPASPPLPSPTQVTPPDQSMGPPQIPMPPPTEIKSQDVVSPISPLHRSPTPSSIQREQSSMRSTAPSPPQSQHKPDSGGSMQPRASTIQRSTKPKRLKAHTVVQKTHSVPVIPRDPVTNEPMLPLNVGIMTVLSLGQVCMREHFHTERYIFPVGYEVARRYFSSTDPNKDVTYHCKILEGPSGPIFQIKAPDIDVIEAGTATGAWSGVVKQANLIRHRQHSNSVSGPDYFGLGQNTIKHLIQGLPGAAGLRCYVWQNYHEGGYGDRPMGGRHAAVMPALPEDETRLFPGGKVSVGDGMELDPEDQDTSLEPAESDNTTPDEARMASASVPNTPTEREMVTPAESAAEEGRLRSMSVSSRTQMSMASLLNSDEQPRVERERSDSNSNSNSGSRSPYPRTAAVSVIRDTTGNPVLPLEVPLATLIDLGRVCEKEGYSNRKFVYPIGYRLEKRWMSALSPDSDVDYDCQILEGHLGPIFQVFAHDQRHNIVSSDTPSAAWASFWDKARSIRGQQLLPMDKGDEYFGLTNPTIRTLVLELPGARRLMDRDE